MTTETQDTRPTHKPLLASASMRHRLLSFSVSDFRPVCIKHALSTQKLTNVLQRMYKLMTGSKHSV
ncbi:hypothetical protein PROFUN_16331, partial [Planoprotostelium fungivorum]